MLTPKFKEFAAVFQSGAVGMFVAYMRHGEKEAWERYCEDIGDLPNDKDFDVSEIVDEIEDYLLTKLPKDERENYLLGVIGVFDFYVEYRELLMDEIMEDRCVGGWEMSFWDFGKTLYLMLLSHGIDMMRLQDECGIYLMEEPDVETVGMWLGSMKLAKKYIEAIQAKREPQQEEKPVDEVKYQQEEAKPVLIDDTVILMNVYNEFNSEIWANIEAVNFLMMMQTGDLTKLEILPKQKSKMRKILGGIRLTTDKEKSNQWCENVMKSTGINAKKATPTVTDDEKINSSGMRKFALTLSKIFPQKAK